MNVDNILIPYSLLYISRKPLHKTQKRSKYKTDFVTVPFIFSTETLSTTIGGACVLKHAVKLQDHLLDRGFYSKNNSLLTYIRVNNYQLPKLDQ